MKKTTIISKKQILTFTMVIALAAAVWLNVKYSTSGADFFSSSKVPDTDLGETKYVATEKVEEDFFSSAKEEREENREENLALLEETLNDVKSTDDAKIKVSEAITKITDTSEKENSIETLILAKGFKGAVVVINDDTCNVVVRSNKDLNESQTVQILDIVSSIAKINLENIKIVAVK